MKEKKRILILFLCFCETLTAQDFIGLNTSNYSGLYNATNQPASIVGSPYKWQFNIVAGDATAHNSQLFSNIFLLKNALEWAFDGSAKEKLNQGQREYFVRGRLNLPSLLVSIGSRGALEDP